MHILIVSSWYPTIEHPLSGIFIREQARALRKAGHQVGVILEPRLKSKLGLAHVRKPNQLFMQVTTTVDEGIPVYHSQTWGWFPAFLHDMNVMLLNRSVEKAYLRYTQKNGSPDLIHGHSILYGGFLATWLGQKRDLPSVVTEHSSAVLRGTVLPKKVKYLERTINQADQILAVSPALANKLRQTVPGAKIEVVGNMVDVNFFSPAEKPLPQSPFHFASIAYLRSSKGIDLLVKAFHNSLRGTDTHLFIAGDGPERDALEKLAASLGISHQVTFLGALDRLAVRDLIRNSHVVVSASRVETFGITLIETLACGKPVIATTSGGPESYLTEQDGMVVPEGNIPLLAAAMKQMKENYFRYQSKEIRRRCVERFSEETIISQLEEIYARLVNA
jgi:glycosyltransferase involved in cell wall biosynthesis